MPVIPLTPDNGVERPQPLAIIDENPCTGCDLCVPPCPVDCITMVPVTGHQTGWDAWSQQEADAARKRHDWRLARLARERDAAEARKAARVAGPSGTESATQSYSQPDTEPDRSVESGTVQPTAAADDAQAKKRAIIQAAMDRARQKKEELARPGAGPKNTDAVSPEVQAQIRSMLPKPGGTFSA